MAEFVLQVQDLLRWRNESEFDDLDFAIAFGKDRFPQNDWRIVVLLHPNRVDTVFSHSSRFAMEEDARSQLNRFRQTDHWRNHYEQRRINAINSFIVNGAHRIGAIGIQNFFGNYKEDNNAKKVNWLKEGF